MSYTSYKMPKPSRLPQVSKSVVCETAASPARAPTRVSPHAFTNVPLGVSVKRGQIQSVQTKTAQQILSHVASPSLSLVVNVPTPVDVEETDVRNLPVQLNKRDTGANINRLTGDVLAPIAMAALCVGILSIGLLFASAFGLIGKTPEQSVATPSIEMNVERGMKTSPATSESLKDRNLERARTVGSK
jgi:hypothetical protein